MLKNPQEFYDKLKSDPYNYKLKGVGPPKYHLGGDFFLSQETVVDQRTIGFSLFDRVQVFALNVFDQR